MTEAQVEAQFGRNSQDGLFPAINPEALALERNAALFLLMLLVVQVAGSESVAPQLKEMGMFDVGGQEVEVGGKSGSDTQVINQALDHYLIPEESTRPYPIVMVPGLGLTYYI